jgi:crotonobetainyl-CoA:carnitine CoA-transferase CaiB-like acyl-CoA transferase
LRHAPPKLGADGEAVLRELGYATEKIAAIKAAGVVA